MFRVFALPVLGLCVGIAACSDDPVPAVDAAAANGGTGGTSGSGGSAPDATCGVSGEMLRPSELASISHCEVIRGGLNLSDMPITTVEPLAKLRVIEGTLNLFRNEFLIDLRGFRGLERVQGDLLLHNGATLRSLAGLERMHTVGGSLAIDANDDLESIDEMSALRSVGADLVIRWNPRLPQPDAERFAARTRVGGKAEVTMNGFEL